MKKGICIMLMLLIVFTAAWACGETAAQPGWTIYEIRDLDMTVRFPEGFIVIYKDMPADDPVLTLYGLTPGEVNEGLEEEYLEASFYPQNGLFFIKTNVPSFEELDMMKDEDIFRKAMEAVGEQLEQQGFELLNISVSRSGDRLYAITGLKYPEGNKYGYRFAYFTLQNSFSVTAICDLGTEEYEAGYGETAYGILDSIAFETVIGDGSAGVTYHDPTGDVSFLWPAGYFRPYYSGEEEDSVMVHEAFVKGIPGNRAVLQYICIDLSKTDPLAGLAEYDTDTMTVSEFARLTGKPASRFEEARYGNNKFFMTRGSNIQLYAVKGKYMYNFQFSEKPDDEIFQDLVRVAESVTYD